jgi:hypothetical protein
MSVARSAVNPLTFIVNPNEFTQLQLEKIFSNHRREKPCGGKLRYAAELNEIATTTSTGNNKYTKTRPTSATSPISPGPRLI